MELETMDLDVYHILDGENVYDEDLRNRSGLVDELIEKRPQEMCEYRRMCSFNHYQNDEIPFAPLYRNDYDGCSLNDDSHDEGIFRSHGEDWVAYCCGKSFKDYHTLIEHDQSCHQTDLVDDIVSIDQEGNIVYYCEDDTYLVEEEMVDMKPNEQRESTPNEEDEFRESQGIYGRTEEVIYENRKKLKSKFIVSEHGIDDTVKKVMTPLLKEEEEYQETKSSNGFNGTSEFVKFKGQNVFGTTFESNLNSKSSGMMMIHDQTKDRISTSNVYVAPNTPVHARMHQKDHDMILNQGSPSIHSEPLADGQLTSVIGTPTALSEGEEIHSLRMESFHSSRLLPHHSEDYLQRKQRKILQLYKCSITGCKKIYTSTNGLRYHEDHGHREQTDDTSKPYACHFTDCTKRFKSGNGLTYHIKNAHKKIKAFHPALIAAATAAVHTNQPITIIQPNSRSQTSTLDLSCKANFLLSNISNEHSSGFSNLHEVQVHSPLTTRQLSTKSPLSALANSIAHIRQSSFKESSLEGLRPS